MPGAYTHISIARLLTSGDKLRSKELLAVRPALLKYPEFCHMGAISPDYPYLNLLNKTSEIWANAMHHKYVTSTEKNIIHVGISNLKRLKGDQQAKCLAWFLGYVSHVTADVTCHPVTNLLVGDYELDGNDSAHRESELHQDVYIFNSRLGGDVRKSEHIKNVIGRCVDRNKKIDQDVETFWSSLVSVTFPKISAAFPISINEWHDAVQSVLDNLAEELSIIPSRHIRGFLTGSGLAYPRPSEVDTARFIDKLRTPKGNRTYDQLFDFTLKKVLEVWKLVSAGIAGENALFHKIRIWNLDNGQEVHTPKVMWEGEA